MTRPQFAVVREDPRSEATLVAETGAEAALVVASGGCTALALARHAPTVRVTAFDANPAQLAHVEAKRRAVSAMALDRLNLDDPDPRGLNACGAFEGLFRVLSATLSEFVAPRAALRGFFDLAHDARRATLARWRGSPFWSVAFELAFSDAMLGAMFGPAATQHAAPGSYPRYFERQIGEGLGRADADTNPFLHHLLLGHYLDRARPDYLLPGPGNVDSVNMVEGGLDAVPGLAQYGLVSLSNIFDWSDDALAHGWLSRLAREGHRRVTVLIRQLNNRRDLGPLLPRGLVIDDAAGRRLLAADRSLFYERMVVVRREGQ